MKLPAGLFLVFLLFSALSAYAQSDSFVIRLRTMKADDNLFDSDSTNLSFGLNLGYGKMLKGNHFGFDVTGFADVLNHNFDLDAQRRFEGSTLYTGFAITPLYCFNPNSDVQLSVATSLKGGYNWGYGDVKGYNTIRGNYSIFLERKTVNGGYSVAYSPMVTLTFPVDFGSLGLELGYDSSNIGQGINKLRSTYYKPVNYNAGYLFLGAFFRLHD